MISLLIASLVAHAVSITNCSAQIDAAIISKGVTIPQGGGGLRNAAENILSISAGEMTALYVQPAQTNLNVQEQTTAVATATLIDNSPYVTWSSSNPSVATVSNGLITGISNGTATITATSRDGIYTSTCTVTVLAPMTQTIITYTSTSGIPTKQLDIQELMQSDISPANQVLSVETGSNLRTLKLSGNVGTFQGCENMTSITLNDGLTSIEDNAFIWCHGLTSVKIPRSVQTIGKYFFAWCNNIQYVDMTEFNDTSSIPTIDAERALDGTSAKIYVANQQMYNAFITSAGWSSLSSRFEINPL